MGSWVKEWVTLVRKYHLGRLYPAAPPYKQYERASETHCFYCCVSASEQTNMTGKNIQLLNRREGGGFSLPTQHNNKGR